MNNKKLCSKGLNQSPINIKTSKIKACASNCNLLFYYRNSNYNIKVFNNNLIISYDKGSYIHYNHDIYDLDKISFSIPSLHKIDKISYPIEAQLYHRSLNTGDILILSIFIEIDNTISNSKKNLDNLKHIISSKNINLRKTKWNIYSLLPESKAFFIYEGSLPRYPCTENILWIIMEDPINCSDNFYNLLKKKINYKPKRLKKLNNRTIYYNSNTSFKNNKNYGYRLKCLTNKDYNKQCIKLKKNIDIKTIILFFTTIIIIINVLYILWLLEKGLLTKYFKNFKKYLINNNIILI